MKDGIWEVVLVVLIQNWTVVIEKKARYCTIYFPALNECKQWNVVYLMNYVYWMRDTYCINILYSLWSFWRSLLNVLFYKSRKTGNNQLDQIFVLNLTCRWDGGKERKILVEQMSTSSSSFKNIIQPVVFFLLYLR